MLPIFISIPHGGSVIPAELTGRTCLTSGHIFDDSDACTIDIYDVGAEVWGIHRAAVARAFVDVNRAPDDLPPGNPDGVIKSVTCYTQPVYREGLAPDADLVRCLLSKYHEPYHDSLSAATASGMVRLALDCHSMAAVGPPTARDAGVPRPMFCLSNGDGQTCPPSLMELLAETIADVFECDVADIGMNRPFKGGYITRRHGHGDTPWVQVEMNRSLYLQDPWFNHRDRHVQPDRLLVLRNQFAEVLQRLRL